MNDRRKRSHPTPPLYYPPPSALLGATQNLGSLSVAWAQLTGIPTTLAGFGITDAYTEAEVDALIAGAGGSLASLSDVDLTGLADGDVLAYDLASGFWLPVAPSGGGGGGAVDSVFTRTGHVVAAVGDYDASHIEGGTFPAEAYIFPDSSSVEVHTTALNLWAITMKGYATGNAWTGGFQLVDDSGNQYGSFGKAQSGDNHIYMQSYLGGFKVWGRAGDIEFAPNGTTTRVTFNTSLATFAMSQLSINGATMTFPGANASGQLTNDGSGGLSWASGGGGSSPTGHHAGTANMQVRYIASHGVASALTTYSLAAISGRTFCVPFVAPARGGTIDLLSVNVTAAVGGSSVVLGIYETLSDTNIYPGALVASGSVATATTGMKDVAISLALTPGRIYWIAAESDATITVSGVSVNAVNTLCGPTETGSMRDHIRFDGGMSNPANTTFVSLTGTVPAFFYRFSA